MAPKGPAELQLEVERLCLLKRHHDLIVVIRMVRKLTVAGWEPALAFPSLRRAFALLSDEVDARVLVLFGRLIVTTRPELELSKACAERSWL